MSSSQTPVLTKDPQYLYFEHPESGVIFAEREDNVGDGIWAECHEIDLQAFLKLADKVNCFPKDPKFKGVLKEARKYKYDQNIIVGKLYFNPQEQFPEGITIHTSRILNIRKDGLYETQYARYYVEWAADGELADV